MTRAAVVMKRLLVRHGCSFCCAFELHRRNFRQKFWLLISSRVTICARIDDRRRIFLEQLCRQRRRAISRKGCLVRWMLDSFRRRLRGVMTVNAGKLTVPTWTAFFTDVFQVIESYLTQL